MATLLNIIYRFNVILLKIPMKFFIELEKIIIKFIWMRKRLQIVKVIPRKKKAPEVSQY
jgi:hypothetical protein